MAMESIAILIVAMAVTAIVAAGTQTTAPPTEADSPKPAPIVQEAAAAPSTVDVQVQPVAKEKSEEQAKNQGPIELASDEVPAKFRQDLTEFIILVDIKKRLSPEQIDLIVESVWKRGSEYNVDPVLLASLIYRESKFYPQAVSRSGAIGLGQLLPSTARHIGVSDPYDIEQNIQGTAYYLKQMMDIWTGYQKQISLALASYKEGITRVKRSGGNYTGHTQRYIDDILTACDQLAPDRY